MAIVLDSQKLTGGKLVWIARDGVRLESYPNPIERNKTCQRVLEENPGSRDHSGGHDE